MIPGNPRSVADRARPPLPCHPAPDQPDRGITFAILLSLPLWALLIPAAIHLFARIFP